MKNVLFATTALVALAGAAAAEVSFSGALTAGYNDEDFGGLFWEADLDLSASVDMGDNVTATASVELFDFANNIDVSTPTVTVEIAYTGDPLSASLKMGDMGDKGASEYFYADRDGMFHDVENHDGDDEVRALVEFGNFGIAVGCDMAGSGTCDSATGFNFGAGATFGSIELGFGYDEADLDAGAGNGDERWGVSADTTFGAASVGVSYISDETSGENSLGVAVGYAVSDALSVGAYYAANSDAAVDDSYGADVGYTAGALTLGVFFDHTKAGTDEYGLDVSYAVNDQLTVNAGYLSGAADSIVNGAGYIDDHFYAGIDYAINDAISATVSYSTADEDLGSVEYYEGVSAFITATF